MNTISVSAIPSKLRLPHDAVMLFGSIARGTASDGSDVDVLQVVPAPKPSYKIAALNVSVYSAEALKEMAFHGSLFILHLKLEGKILYDPKNVLLSALNYYRPMQDYSPFFEELICLTGFLDITESDYLQRAAAVNQMAIFILRSTLFALLAQQGRPRFAMNQVAECFEDPSILQAYSLKQHAEPANELFCATKALIEKYLRCKIQNPFGSYEALLLKTTKKSQFVQSVALHFFRRFSGEEAYGIFKKQINGSNNHNR